MRCAILFCFLGVLCIAAAESYAEKKDEIKAFTKCIACSPGDELKNLYKACTEMEPKRIGDICEECKEELIPGEDTEGRWKKICEDVDIVDKIYECVSEKLTEDPITEEEKEQKIAFKQCLEDINEHHCPKV